MRSIARTRWLFLWSACFCLAATGCGYHTTAQSTQLPDSVKTIASPSFVNQTQTYRIEQQLTGAVVREMTTRTHYHVLNDADESADATLRGTVISTSLSPLAYDSQSGRAASVLVTVSMKVSLTDRSEKFCLRTRATCFTSSTKSRANSPASSKRTRRRWGASPRLRAHAGVERPEGF